MIPASTRRAVSAKASTVTAWVKSGLRMGGKTLWVVGTSALLLGVPWALAYSEEQMIVEQERAELQAQRAQNEVWWRLFPSRGTRKTLLCTLLMHQGSSWLRGGAQSPLCRSAGYAGQRSMRYHATMCTIFSRHPNALWASWNGGILLDEVLRSVEFWGFESKGYAALYIQRCIHQIAPQSALAGQSYAARCRFTRCRSPFHVNDAPLFANVEWCCTVP